MFCSAQQCQSHFAVIWNGEEYGCAGMCAEMRIRCCRPSSVDDYATPSSACPAVGGTTLRVRAIDGPVLRVLRNGPSQRLTQRPSQASLRPQSLRENTIMKQAPPEPQPAAARSGVDLKPGVPSPVQAAAVAADDEQQRLTHRLTQIRHKILVLSGKGGVGKSTVAANLAISLAMRGYKVGLLDIDMHGPSIPKLLGLENEGCSPGPAAGELLPVTIAADLKVMSIGFLLQSPRDAVVWRGPLKYKLIQQFLGDVVWGALDVLVIDSPPGTGDEPLSVAQLVGWPASAVVVTTPQEVAVADVRRSITFCEQVHLQVLGLIENMSGFLCPHCGRTTALFKEGGGELLAREMNVPFLGRVPLDSQVVVSGDAGTPFVDRFADSGAARAFAQIVSAIVSRIEPAQPDGSAIGRRLSK